MKTEERKELTFDLGVENYQAKILLRRVGQQEPEIGDGVIVRARIFLPLNNGEIPWQLRFEKRIPEGFVEVPLGKYWGSPVEGYKEFRGRAREFDAARWADAFEDAQIWALTELQKLLDAIGARKQALVDAEKTD